MNDYMKSRMENILSGRPLKTKEKKPIPKKSAKRIEKEKQERDRLGGDDTELVKFFKNAMKRMVGVCAETGLKTETKIYRYAICSICHILPRSKCPSVATHPLIWMEFEPGFHVKFDAMSWDEREQLGCWPQIREKLTIVYESLDPSEHRHFPQSVLDYMEKNNPF